MAKPKLSSPAEGWEIELCAVLKQRLTGDPLWAPKLAPLLDPQGATTGNLHLAVFVEPYLELVLAGKKTIESRFGVRHVPPFQAVQCGDVILLKRASGPVVGLCEVGSVWFYELDRKSWDEIRKDFAVGICPQEGFWDERKQASLATLIRVTNVTRLSPISCAKRDRRGWVIVSPYPKRHQLTLGIV